MKKIRETEKVKIDISDKKICIHAVKVIKVNDSFLKADLTETGNEYFIWDDRRGWSPLPFDYMSSELGRKWILRLLDILKGRRDNNETKLLVNYAIDKQFSDFKRRMEWYY